jgi:uncharacterized protein YqeY
MAHPLVDQLRSDLTAAMKARDSHRVAALRSALSAIANAEAVAAPATAASLSPSPIAGAVSGLGAGEVARQELSDEEVIAVVRSEFDKRSAGAAEFEDLGRDDHAAQLRAEAAVLADYL